MSNPAIENLQKEVCRRFNAPYEPSELNLKVGVSRDLKLGGYPINGLRISKKGDTNGWYIWIGDWSDADDFFVPLHGFHLCEWCEKVIPYLGLPAGWRFLLAEGYEDVWFDPDLQNS
ncbi:hypothetical protein [Chitinivorax sp. B]|uniref:immunity protein Imm33 domain-containing protein n=1 Tax=Chitinivorax sp. B TaxID=2502235 RepID=UPI0010F91BC4|nr:hypothetical protein [Chitinivorax sp. B]